MSKIKAWIATPGRIPQIGILAFALASTYALVNLFNEKALHPSPIYWIPASLVEIITAWMVYQLIEKIRLATLSLGGKKGTSKQDRRFNLILIGFLIILTIPTLGASIAANAFEFQAEALLSGETLLSLLFPFSCIGCAIGAILPQIEDRRIDERLEAQKEETRKANAQVKRMEEFLKAAGEEAIEIQERHQAALSIMEAEINQLNDHLSAPIKLQEPKREDLIEILQGMNGQGDGISIPDLNRELIKAGFWTISESTLRGWRGHARK